MVCFVFITPLAAISGWLCLRGAQDHLRLHSRLEAVGLIALTIALFTIYVLWTLVSGLSRGPWPVCECRFRWRRSPQLTVAVAPGWRCHTGPGHPQPTVNLSLKGHKGI